MYKATFAAALSAAVAQATDAYSREGRDISFVVALNAPALTTPQTSLNLAVEPTQEPKYANRITPVGQRQQFLIGSELRRRYVDEAQMLDAEYKISQLYLQAPFVAQNILSLQAQMMGLYPSTHANDLTEWQQANAVPPIEGADFTKWQQELGASALPYGLQTFPIQQTGFEKDFVLSVNEKNCKRYGASYVSRSEAIVKTLETAVATEYPQIESEIQESGVTAVELCDYLTWAHFNAVPLTGDAQRQSDYSGLVSKTCQESYYNLVTEAVVQINSENDNLVATGFMTKLVDYINLVAEAKSQNAVDLPLAFVNYQALSGDVVYSILDTISAGSDWTYQTLPASSSLIFEVNADQTIIGYVNDESFTLLGCVAGSNCAVADFVAAVQDKITYTDLEKACNGSSDDVELAIQA